MADAVSPAVTLTSTELNVGQPGYLMCRVSGGNPRPLLQWICNQKVEHARQLSYQTYTLLLYSFISTEKHNGQICICYICQLKTKFQPIQKSLTLQVSSK